MHLQREIVSTPASSYNSKLCGAYTYLRGLIVTRGRGDIQAQAAAYGHVWVRDPSTAGVCVVCPLLVSPQGLTRTMCEPRWRMRAMLSHTLPHWELTGPSLHHGLDKTIHLWGLVLAVWSEQPSYHPETHPGLYVSTDQHLTHVWSGVCEGTGPAGSP